MIRLKTVQFIQKNVCLKIISIGLKYLKRYNCANKWLLLLKRLLETISNRTDSTDSQSAIAPSKSSTRHLVSAQNWWMQTLTGWSTFVFPLIEMNRRMSLLNSSLLLLQCLVCFTKMVCVRSAVTKILSCSPLISRGQLPPMTGNCGTE